jgi:hypothetical protein
VRVGCAHEDEERFSWRKPLGGATVLASLGMKALLDVGIVDVGIVGGADEEAGDLMPEAMRILYIILVCWFAGIAYYSARTDAR